ncbi:type III secretion system export apparatus subunit SctV [Pseudomonas fluorescens]|uniref:Type III secretion system export apparatus subunit SctV n=1 Tax=Pseudomonas fluorescens TaxID=294 RepID=A0A944HCA2_PSEFL|nr:type III secretion system export apparatus subunit SctV [Pseudomonas fluorescens]MBT2298535.1 type III secretion system export apparatus subunit SctV [Pseudomonas fluorescens]MBT2310060.1 type III secretion system export apparatus subunit SctV [Pseudomonas fluorescens]MBT2311084.1 type III secretion system export apparatus subunit SctV [Pseudomonas fluorescens]MBT2319981.1 type III secretion system export apparatus subunit SctV [Pseudomonas fluorescens]MBT2328991.1 type III secretion system
MNRLIHLLNKLALAVMSRTEIVGAVMVMAIVFMMILPLPTALLDVLIALNICISSLLIVLAMYLPRPLAFSTFPAVLLLTTMFRLALSIATTRLILIQQDAGHIVEAFGSFVVGGNLAVGLVIFLILTVVNFLVITKGSERVAEVAARFTLDAMPGKQMSIDSDLRANLITVREARQRREQLSKESQLFGAMDGAMKFVKGDAIAGLVIVFINLIGGFSIGVLQNGMEAADAMHLYSVLTIGDGLIAQIPALLISLTAGMIITRVAPDSSAPDANIGHEIAEQLTSQPKAWVFSSIGMLGFAAIPGMPGPVFVSISLICLSSGLMQLWRVRQKQLLQDNATGASNGAPELNGREDIRRFNPSRAYLLRFHPSHQGTPELEALLHGIRQRRNTLVHQFGLTLPSFDLEFNEQQPIDEFCFCVYEVPLVRATFSSTLQAVDAQQAGELHDGIAGRPDREETRWVWFETDHSMLRINTVEAISAQELILERMGRAFQATGPQFIGLQESKAILGWLENEQPELAQELQRTLPLARFAAVLQRLSAELVSLRSVRPIAETLIEQGQHERDLNALTDYVRIALKAQICHQHAEQGALNAWLVTPETEVLLRDALRQTQSEAYFALEPETGNALLEQLRHAFPLRARPRPVLLVAQDLRSPLHGLLNDEFNHVPVLSFAELLSTVHVQVLGRIELDDAQAALA